MLKFEHITFLPNKKPIDVTIEKCESLLSNERIQYGYIKMRDLMKWEMGDIVAVKMGQLDPSKACYYGKSIMEGALSRINEQDTTALFDADDELIPIYIFVSQENDWEWRRYLCGKGYNPSRLDRPREGILIDKRHLFAEYGFHYGIPTSESLSVREEMIKEEKRQREERKKEVERLKREREERLKKEEEERKIREEEERKQREREEEERKIREQERLKKEEEEEEQIRKSIIEQKIREEIEQKEKQKENIKRAIKTFLLTMGGVVLALISIFVFFCGFSLTVVGLVFWGCSIMAIGVFLWCCAYRMIYKRDTKLAKKLKELRGIAPA